MELRRAELVETTKKRKIIERLKGRDNETYNMEVRKAEQVFIDELTAQRFNNHPDK